MLAAGCLLIRGSPLEKTPQDAFEGRCALSAKLPPASPSGSMLPLEQLGLPPESVSPQTWRIAWVIGAQDLLRTISALKPQVDESPDARQRLLQAVQQLETQVQMAVLDVESVEAEVRCERERAEHLANRLQAAHQRIIKQLTVAAIISSAVFGFGASGLFLAGLSTAGSSFSIAGGVVTTILGTAALTIDVQHEFRHPRNILKEIQEAPEQATTIPPTVWRFLTLPQPEDPLQRSLRQTLVLAWQEEGQLGRPGSETARRRTPLLLGEGGIYESADLQARAAMLKLLEADVALMTQDLNFMIREVLAPRSPAPHD